MRVFSVNYIPSAAAFVFIRHEETITIRSFHPLPSRETEGANIAAQADIERLFLQPGTPFGHEPINTTLAYPGDLFMGSHDAMALYQHVDTVCWSPDADFLGSAAVSDRAAWMFMASRDGKFLAPYNRTLETLPTRAHRNTVYQTHQANSVLTICQPYADSPLEDCTVFVKYAEQAGYRHNFGQTIPRVQGTPSPADVFAELRVTGPETIVPSDTVTVTVEVLAPITREVDTRCNSTLYLEDVDGYAPSLRVKVTDGVGSFRASADGLQPGDRMRIKVGWRNWPGEVEYSPLVV
jgi:hypothetical protein